MSIASSSFSLSKLIISSKDLDLSKHFSTQNAIFEFHNSSKSPNFATLNYSIRNNVNIFIFKCTGASDPIRTPPALVEEVDEPKFDDGGEGGGNGRFPSNGGGDEEEFGPIMKFEDITREAEKRGVNLPDDMLEAAKTMGLRRLVLTRYLDL